MQALQRKIEYKVQPQPQPRSRVVKIEGNVAYISSGAAAAQPRTAPRPAAKPAAKPAVKPAARPKSVAKPAAKPKRGIVSTLAVLMAAFAAMAMLVSRYAEACAVGARNNDLKESIASVETQIEALKVDIEMKSDLMGVQQTARQQLNMTYPSPDQIITIESGG